MANWQVVANSSDLQPGNGMQVVLDGNVLALFNLDGKFYAIDDMCTHAGGSLAEGSVADSVVTCPWHGATFDIKTGAVLSDPADQAVKSYPVKVEGEDVLVEL